MKISGINPGSGINAAFRDTVKGFRSHTGGKVTEHNYTLPKGMHTNLLGSYSYKQMSAKARRIKAAVDQMKDELRQVEFERTDAGDRQDKKQSLKRGIRYLEAMLNREMAALCTVKVNVAEQE